MVLDIIYIATTEFYIPAFKAILITSVVAPFVMKVWNSVSAPYPGLRYKCWHLIVDIL